MDILKKIDLLFEEADKVNPEPFEIKIDKQEPAVKAMKLNKNWAIVKVYNTVMKDCGLSLVNIKAKTTFGTTFFERWLPMVIAEIEQKAPEFIDYKDAPEKMDATLRDRVEKIITRYSMIKDQNR